MDYQDTDRQLKGRSEREEYGERERERGEERERERVHLPHKVIHRILQKITLSDYSGRLPDM